ncbi:SDR family oxidoreductase [Sphingobium boeckii]|uniref:NADP-dependent 3-hydroxy acid dehydrogenase YdfG n=1 Tax=Sphingobium boeckii TaxID=1082345 RepID=A0A7W9AJT1_9SPHN|nr:SDR family NAD(P)-dependent oxidoreductase [Sphingobium boeckii]MBB5686724.1 NADP-dependent 3-hydroxy acid dehydrogenase YdfG [Sphingobium boeckii]
MAIGLAGKVALVTGASSGIGEATALGLAEAGAVVALSARRADRLHTLVARIESAGGRALALPGDIAVEAEASKAVADTIAQLGRIDILVNSAGVIQAGGVESLSLDEWRRVIEINLMGTLYTCKAAIWPMKAQGAGDIINISSTSGRRAAGMFGPYSTSKFGLTGLTEGLRQEVGGAGIRVSIVEPGATATEVAGGITDPAMRAAMAQHVTKDGAMQPSDIADAIVFIASLPARVNVSQILIRPTIDTAPM